MLYMSVLEYADNYSDRSTDRRSTRYLRYVREHGPRDDGASTSAASYHSPTGQRRHRTRSELATVGATSCSGVVRSDISAPATY